MTRTEELLALAEASIKERPARNRLYKLQDATNPETIKQLVELCRLQNEALKLVGNNLVPDYGQGHFAVQRFDKLDIEKAIAAFNKFEGGE